MAERPKKDSSAVPAEPQTHKSVTWDSTWDEKTALMAYEHAREMQRTAETWIDAIDNKVVTVFGVSSGVIGVVTALASLPEGAIARIPWILALGAWGFSAFYCWTAFKPREFRLDPEARLLLDEKWLSLKSPQFLLDRLSNMGTSVAFNKTVLSEKANALRRALGWAVAEVGLLVGALLLA